ncbi:hypothetical protein Tco_0120258 [Tanacetum coccineum]
MIADIEETFATLLRINIKLNPKKCILRVENGQFLGHMITKEGIKANPDKVKAIVNMASPRNIREVQSLNGRLAALGRFLARSAEKTLSFFNSLKGCINKSDFQWRGYQFSPYGRQTPGSETNLLRKQSFARAGEELPPNRKVIISIGEYSKTPTSVLLSLPSLPPYRPTNSPSAPQT